MALEQNVSIGINSRKAEAGAKRVNTSLNSISKTSKRVHAEGAVAAKKHGAALGRMAKMAVYAAAAIGAAFGVRQIAKFGEAISDLSAITGATGEDLEFLRDKAKEFGEQTTLSATEAAVAIKLIASAKPDLLANSEALAQVTKEAIALAEATGQDLPTAARTLGVSLNQMGAGAEEASRFINVLAAGAQKGSSEVADTAAALEYAGTTAALAGISFEELNAMIQLLSTNAITSTKAGTQLRVVLARLQKAGGDLDPAVVGINQALRNFNALGLGATETFKFFGIEAADAGRILSGNVDQLIDLTEAISDTSIAYEQQRTRVANLSGDYKVFKSVTEGLVLALGDQGLDDALRRGVQSASDMVRSIAQSDKVMSNFGKIVGAAESAISALANATGTFIDLISGPFNAAVDVGTKAISAIAKGFIELQDWLEPVYDWMEKLSQVMINDLATAGAEWGRIINEELIPGLKELIASITDTSHYEIWSDAVKTGLETVSKVVSVLWDNFVIGGPANLRLATILIIANIDKMRVRTIAKLKTLKTDWEIVWTKLAGITHEVINKIRIKISQVFEDISLSMAEALRDIAANTDKIPLFDGMTDSLLAAAEGLDSAKGKTKELQEELARGEKANTDYVLTLEAENEQIEKNKKAEINAIDLIIQDEIRLRDARIAAGKATSANRRTGDGTGGGGFVPTERVIAPPPILLEIEEIADASSTLFDMMEEKGIGVIDGLSNALGDFARDGKVDFGSLATSIIADLIRIQMQSYLTDIFKGIGLGEGTSGGTVDAGVPAQMGGATGLSFVVGGRGDKTPIQGFARGGGFKVDGVSGRDKNLVVFKATKGEQVDVRTPQQVRQGRGRGKGETKVQFVVNNFSDAKVKAQETTAPNGDVLIEATISAVATNIGQNGEVFQALKSREALERR